MQGGYGGCGNDNFISTYRDDYRWTILPAYSAVSSNTYMIGTYAFDRNAHELAVVNPTTYLKSNIQIVGGNGDNEPYKLAM